MFPIFNWNKLFCIHKNFTQILLELILENEEKKDKIQLFSVYWVDHISKKKVFKFRIIYKVIIKETKKFFDF